MANPTSDTAFALRDPGDFLSASTVRHMDVMAASETDIAKRAYEKYEIRGRMDGFDLDDWLAATRELTGLTFGHLSSPSLSPTQFPADDD